MNKIVLSFLTLLCCINIQAGVKLQKQGSATQLVVNDKPMLLLAGELSNSAATSPADIRKALKQMKNSGVNSVFVPAYWEFVEPNEGKNWGLLFDQEDKERIIEDGDITMTCRRFSQERIHHSR